MKLTDNIYISQMVQKNSIQNHLVIRCSKLSANLPETFKKHTNKEGRT
jgi:hypothetical protein